MFFEPEPFVFRLPPQNVKTDI